MAKAKPMGLGRGLDALLGGASKQTAPAETTEAQVQTFAETSAEPVKASKLPSVIDVDDNGGLWVNPNLLQPNPKQPRVEFNQKALEELSASIKANGILEPIIIEHIEGDTFYIIAGERRTRAAKMAGLDKVPVQLRKFDEQKKLEVALIENIQRADLNPIEEAMAYYNLIQMGDLTQDEVARRVGKNRTTVANAIRLLKLPEDMQHALASGQISSGHARALLMVKSDADMRVLFAKIVGSDLTVRQAEELAGTYNNGGRAAAKKQDKKPELKDPNVADFEQQLKNIFGVKGVSLKGTMEKGSLVIDYTTRGDFDRICEILLKSAK